MGEVSEKPATIGAGLIRDWVHGWVVSREVAPAVEIPGGFRIEVGLPDHLRRYILVDANPEVMRDLIGRIHQPGVWIKAFAEEAEFRSFLTPEWVVEGSGHMMVTALRRTTVDVPDGYSVQHSRESGLLVVRVLAADGELAACGQMGVAGPIAVADLIGTEEPHRRRGLGVVVLKTLANLAVAEGAQKGVLVATDEGKALYLTLGWELRGYVTGAWIPLPASETMVESTFPSSGRSRDAVSPPAAG